jgi:hypothetical protein
MQRFQNAISLQFNIHKNLLPGISSHPKNIFSDTENYTNQGLSQEVIDINLPNLMSQIRMSTYIKTLCKCTGFTRYARNI